jgi:LacI family transcriptional regulator
VRPDEDSQPDVVKSTQDHTGSSERIYMVTSRDVARLAGVSQATVSRALSSSRKVSADTTDRVKAAVETLQYVPHAGAQAMKTRRAKTLGVVVTDMANPFYSEQLDELTKVLDTAGYRVVLWNADGAGHHDALNAIRDRAVDGVIFTSATDDSAELQAALDRDSPIVLINRIIDGLECDQVTSDNRAGGVIVADYLIDQNKTCVAFIGGSENASTSRNRGEGFMSRMAERGYPIPEGLHSHGAFSHEQSFQIMSELIASPHSLQAVFCANDFMAFGAIDAVRSHGLSVPNDFWVIGYDDVDMASWASFDLTTVRQPSREMARVGAKMLLNRIESPELAMQHVVFPCELKVRGSTRAPS